MEHLVQRAAETMVALGIASQAKLAPYLQTWLARPPDENTSDEDSELAAFLSQLFQAEVITRSQGRTLLAMLTQPGAPAVDDPFVGRRFGSFVAEELIGEGAMGKVYRACREGTLERDYVIKVFTNPGDPVGVRRFQLEGDIMAKLDHPNIVKVVGSGEEGSNAFLVLEYFEGPTLMEMLEQRGRFSWKSATRAVKQIALALAAGHEQGVIHRDIKPHNVMVAPGGMLKVFDFGLAKTVGSVSGGLSQAGEILGSPAYMAPEQWGDHKVDERVDLFALGVIYYLLVSGEVPFKGRTPADYSWKIREGHYERIDKVLPELPEGVAQVITQLLETDRAYRTPSAKRLSSDLDRVLTGRGPNVPRLEVSSGEQTGKRFPLVGSDSFAVGSNFETAVFVDGAGVLDAHATLERSEAGLLLTAFGDTQVNGKPVREIVLRDKDAIVFGESNVMRYRAGNVGKRASTRHLSASEVGEEAPSGPVTTNPGLPIVISGLVAAALQSFAHKRSLLYCFEDMDPYGIERALEASRQGLVGAGFAEGAVDQIHGRAQGIAQERVWQLADNLFTTTRENLGRSVEAWLAWWFESRGSTPQQLRPPGERAKGRLIVTASPGAKPFTVELGDKEDWVVGRSEDAGITIPERSVSRQHVTLHRMISQFAYVDLGSRFGTTIGGKRVSVGTLRHRDELRLGRATLEFRDGLRAAPERAGPNVEVDISTFKAMVDMRLPAVTLTLVRLLDSESLAAYCVQAISAYTKPHKVTEGIRAFLSAERERALEALPAITGVNHGSDPALWLTWLAANQGDLGTQVEPKGWGATG